MRKPVIFTDLDGTLLHPKTYSFDAALQALDTLRAKSIPLVLCSSKTRKEIEYYRGKIGNTDPFISENGGAVFIPKGYFSVDLEQYSPEDGGDYVIKRLGAKYRDLRGAVGELREKGFDIRGFGDMTPEEIAVATGLGGDEAAMAKMREFDEPFLFRGDDNEREKLVDAVRTKGFNLTRGLFYHILGNSDKGRAVSILIDIYRRQYGEIMTAAFGDSLNDLPMLRLVDHPVIVEKHGRGYDPHFTDEDFYRAEGVGPTGWNRAVMRLLSQINQ